MENFEFEEPYSCLFGGKVQQEYDNYFIRSINHELYLQKVRKFTLSCFDDKRCDINETASKPWEKVYNLMFHLKDYYCDDVELFVFFKCCLLRKIFIRVCDFRQLL